MQGNNTSMMLHNSFIMVRFKICSLSNSQVYKTLWLTLITLLFIRSLELIYKWKFTCFVHLPWLLSPLPLLHTHTFYPQALITTILVFGFYEFTFFYFTCMWFLSLLFNISFLSFVLALSLSFFFFCIFGLLKQYIVYHLDIPKCWRRLLRVPWTARDPISLS